MDNNNNAKDDGAGTKTTANADNELNPNSNNNLNPPHSLEEQDDEQPRQSTTRTPFTNLSQMEADLALARTLQEQERAYMMLRVSNEGSAYGSWESGSYVLDVDEEDNFDDPHDDSDDHDVEDEFGRSDNDEDDGDSFHMHIHDDDDEEDDSPNVEHDPSTFSSDEAYARALQDAEEREVAARLLALSGLSGLNGREADYDDGDDDDHGGHSQDTWDEVDPDELSYEELLALGEVVGSESRGLSVDIITSLPSVKYAGSSQNGSNDSCVICRLDYEDGETLTLLSCKHTYHSECINNWLQINKVCPVCSTEVSTSGSS